MAWNYFTDPVHALTTIDPNLRIEYLLMETYTTAELLRLLYPFKADWRIGLFSVTYDYRDLDEDDWNTFNREEPNIYLVCLNQADSNKSFTELVGSSCIRAALDPGSTRLDVLVPRVCRDLVEARAHMHLCLVGQV